MRDTSFLIYPLFSKPQGKRQAHTMLPTNDVKAKDVHGVSISSKSSPGVSAVYRLPYHYAWSTPFEYLSHSSIAAGPGAQQVRKPVESKAGVRYGTISFRYQHVCVLVHSKE